MRKLHAELVVLYTKLHTIHYNVRGGMFYPIHKTTEGYYEFVHRMIDEVAESIVMERKMPYGTMVECLEVAKIKELESKPISSHEAMNIILEDFRYLVEYVNAESVSGVHNQNAQNALDEIQTKLEKEIWFLEATLNE